MAESDDLSLRKPARKIADIPKEVLQALERGRFETKNLTEWLAVDRVKLLMNLTDPLELPITSEELRSLQRELKDQSALKQSQAVGRLLSSKFKVGDAAWKRLSSHGSDVVREWCAITVGLAELPFPKKLAWIKLFADDINSGLREIAWISLREDVIQDPQSCIASLIPWTGSRSERLRRYASEITRPRGVWCSHVQQLKENPEWGLPILEPLMSDSSRYVQDSVANWLNDASKSQAGWVREVTQQWLDRSDCSETKYIVRRALRTLG
jgi:3-methyladenine DNA glycosylase AlkC